MRKMFIQKIIVVLKLRAFGFEISRFSSSGFCFSFILHLLQMVCVASKAWLSFTLQVCTCNFQKAGVSTLVKQGQICIKDKLQIL